MSRATEHVLSAADQQFDEYGRHAGWVVRCSCGEEGEHWLVMGARYAAEEHLRTPKVS